MADIQTVLVEDDQQTRLDLRVALRSQEGIEVASEATNGETGLVLLESIDVDVAVVDSTLPDISLAEFVEKMRDMQAESYVTLSKVLILVDAGSGADLPTLMRSGADGYCPKQAPIERLAAAVRAVYAGERYVDPVLAGESL
ncbi:response regulator transcription factor [Thermosynechococcus sp. OHK43]|uniref:response regulator n=1 Tax=Thermosynechococcus sp. OHK43 TaxID=2763133 RepID=UPI0025FAACE1|nr:response regulator transcription factor [Thermosynechococcus sp. OHK43]